MQKVSLKIAKREDAEFTHQILREKDYQKYVLARLISKNQKEEADKIEKLNKNYKKTGNSFYIIYYGKERAGFITSYKAVPSDKRCDIGYGITKKFYNKGIATAAVKIILKKLKKQNFHSCEAITHTKNKASIQVLKKAGFEKVGIMIDYYYEKGKYVDRELYWKIL